MDGGSTSINNCQVPHEKKETETAMSKRHKWKMSRMKKYYSSEEVLPDSVIKNAIEMSITSDDDENCDRLTDFYLSSGESSQPLLHSTCENIHTVSSFEKPCDHSYTDNDNTDINCVPTFLTVPSMECCSNTHQRCEHSSEESGYNSSLQNSGTSVASDACADCRLIDLRSNDISYCHESQSLSHPIICSKETSQNDPC